MADTKISALPAVVTPAGTDELAVNQSGTSKKLTLTQTTDFVKSAINFTSASSSGSASLALFEDTDNGTNKITLTVPSAIASDKTITLPDTTGTVALLSDLVGKQTIYIPASGMTAATTNGAASAQLESTTNKINYAVLDFDGATAEYAHFNIAMPKGWDEGTVTFQVFWATTNTGTAGVAWGLQGVAISDADTIDTAFGTAVYVTDAGQSSAAKLYVTAESSSVTIGGTPAEGDLCYFRLSRDPSNGSDTMTEDARFIGIKLFYTTNALTDN
jgi:hypothetical protein